MKITLCGSIAFYDQMLEVKEKLEQLGHEVKLPPTHVPGPDGQPITVAQYYEIRKKAGSDERWVWERKAEAIRAHFDKVAWADTILVTNYDKKGIVGYIGANTFLEMGVAFHLCKPIYLLNVVPQIDSFEEIMGLAPVVINGDLTKIA